MTPASRHAIHRLEGTTGRPDSSHVTTTVLSRKIRSNRSHRPAPDAPWIQHHKRCQAQHSTRRPDPDTGDRGAPAPSSLARVTNSLNASDRERPCGGTARRGASTGKWHPSMERCHFPSPVQHEGSIHGDFRYFHCACDARIKSRRNGYLSVQIRGS